MVAQLIESSPVEPLVVGVHLFPGDTWFREVRVVSTTSQQPVDLSAWVFEAKLGDGVGTVDASRADEGLLSVTFAPSVTAPAKRGTQLTIVGMLDGGRRTFVVGRVGAEVGSSIPVGLVQRKRVVQTDVDISVYAAPRGDKGADGTAISRALVEQVETDRKAAGTSAFNAGASAAAAQSSEEEAQRAEGVAVASAEQARVYAAGTVALQDAAVAGLVEGETAARQALLGTIDAAVPPVVAATIADAPGIITAAAELAQSDAGLMRVEMVDATSEGNRLDMSFPDRPKFMTLVELPDDSPYLTYVQYSTGEFHSYEKKNGEVYPPRTAPVTPTTPPPFYIVGDSVAEAWTTNTADLTSATGRAVAVEGIGGQPSPPIAARQGGVPARVSVNGDSIPATGTVSVTAITEADGTALSPMHLTANGSRTREVVVNGARCTLASTTASGVTTYTLAQVNGATAMPCPAGTPMVPPARAAGTVTVLLGPRNDLGPSVGDAFRQPLEKILARYKAMIDRAKLNGGRVILLPVVPRTDATTEGRANLVTLNNALRDLAPQDWADWLAWLKSDAAFTAAGVTKSTDDATDIANGDTPRSFRSDTLHLNAAGYRAANRFISLVNSARGL